MEASAQFRNRTKHNSKRKECWEGSQEFPPSDSHTVRDAEEALFSVSVFLCVNKRIGLDVLFKIPFYWIDIFAEAKSHGWECYSLQFYMCVKKDNCNLGNEYLRYTHRDMQISSEWVKFHIFDNIIIFNIECYVLLSFML